jgi:hypothetical protein
MQIINEAVLDHFRFSRQCENCGEYTLHGAHAHHLNTRGKGGGSRLDIEFNVMALCWKCHRYHHDGKEPKYEDLLEIVARRENLTAEAIEEAVRDILRLPKGSSLAGQAACYPSGWQSKVLRIDQPMRKTRLRGGAWTD